jgi:hypothetical protein
MFTGLSQLLYPVLKKNQQSQPIKVLTNSDPSKQPISQPRRTSEDTREQRTPIMKVSENMEESRKKSEKWRDNLRDYKANSTKDYLNHQKKVLTEIRRSDGASVEPDQESSTGLLVNQVMAHFNSLKSQDHNSSKQSGNHQMSIITGTENGYQ